MTQTIYKVNLTKIDGPGDFNCPVCRTFISPDDMDEKTYKILEVRSEGNFLAEVLLQCNKCHNTIRLVGFDVLREPTEEKTIKVKPKGKTDKQILQLLEDGSSLTLYEIADELGKKPKVVFKAIRKLFEKGKIITNPATRSYMLST